MSTSQRVLNIAEKEIGYKENPPRSNRTKYGEWFGFNGVPWCSIFVAWVLGMANMDPRKTIQHYASCASALAGWARLGRTVPVASARPGDILYFRLRKSSGGSNHTGFATSAPYKRMGVWYIKTIEGNTNSAGSRTGGQVMAKTRSLSTIVGVARPAYNEEINIPVTVVSQPQPMWQPPKRPLIIAGNKGRMVEIAQWELAVISGYQFPSTSLGVYDLHLIAAVRNLGKILDAGDGLERMWDGVSIGDQQWASIDGLYHMKGYPDLLK